MLFILKRVMFCYVNGESAGSKQRTLKNSFAPEGIYVGLMANGQLNGSVDEIIFFDRTISLGEAKALYDSKNNNLERNFTGLEKGAHDILGYAVDVNSVYSNQRTVVLGSPEDELVVKFTNPTEGYVVSVNELPLPLEVLLSKHGKKVEYSLDGGARVSMATADSLHYTASVEGVTNGNHIIQIYAEDIYGKILEGAQVSFGVVVSSYPIINFLEPISPRMAPHTVHADAISSVNMEPWEKSTFVWDFDANNQELSHLTTMDPRTGRTVDVAKEQQGFNAAYIYKEPGTYTVKLIAYDKDRNVETTAKTITILPDTRTKRYIDAVGGSDGNDGTSPESAWKTLGYSWTQITSNMALMFKRGQVHEVMSGNSVGPRSNIYLGAYGIGDKPILKWTGANEDVAVFEANTASENVFIENIYFDTIYKTTLDEVLGSKIDALAVSGKSITLANSEFYNFSTIVDMGGAPKGVFIFNDNGWRARRFNFFATGGKGIVIIGADFKASLDESVIRFLPNSQGSSSLINIEWTHFDQEEKIKSAFRYQAVQYGHIYQSIMDRGSDKIGQDESDTDYVVLDGVVIRGEKFLSIGRNANNIMFRNSVFELLGSAQAVLIGTGTDCDIGGYLTVKNLSFVNNLFRINAGSNAKVLTLSYSEGWQDRTPDPGCYYMTDIGEITISNNLFVAPSEYAGANNQFVSVGCSRYEEGVSAALPCVNFSLSAPEDYFNVFSDFSGNVFSTISDTKEYIAIGGTAYNWGGLNSLSFSNGLARENIALDDVLFPDYRPDSAKYPITTSNARAVEGVAYDYYGNLRQGDVWYAGAVDAPGVEETCAELGGNICLYGETCSGNILRSKDSGKCCDNICIDGGKEEEGSGNGGSSGGSGGGGPGGPRSPGLIESFFENVFGEEDLSITSGEEGAVERRDVGRWIAGERRWIGYVILVGLGVLVLLIVIVLVVIIRRQKEIVGGAESFYPRYTTPWTDLR